MPWLVAVVKPNQYNLARVNLLRQGYDNIFYPVLATRRVMKNNVIQSVSEAMFPGYVFISLRPDQRWAPINSTSGISRCLTKQRSVHQARAMTLGDGFDAIATIPEEFISNLRKQCAHQNGVDWLKPGVKVKLVRGPLVQHEGLVASLSGPERVNLLLHLFDRDMEVSVSISDVMPAEVD